MILLGAGSASRFGLDAKKQWIYSGDRPLWLQVAENFSQLNDFAQIMVVSSARDIKVMKHFAPFHFVQGGASRQASLKNALDSVQSEFVLVSDIARCCIDADMVQRVLDAKNEADCIVPAIPVVDTLYIDGRPADRTAARRIQTPQLSRKSILQKAFSAGREYTDESSAIAESGGSVFFVEGSPDAHKLTTTDDLKLLSCIEKPSGRTLTGFGIDIHQFEDGKDMTLGGVRIAVPFGFKAHSDGDVAIHALIDALLGAAGFGDIGEFYPDTDEEYRGADSAVLLADTVRMLRECGLEIVNTDMTIVAQTPRLLPYKEKMRYRLSELMGIRPNFVNIKATTAEKMGFIGRKEGVAVKAVANLRYFDWTKK